MKPSAASRCRRIRRRGGVNYPSEHSQRMLPLVYRWIDVDVHPNTTDRGPGTFEPSDFRGGCPFSADHHQRYLAKNPNAHCGIAGCEIPYRFRGFRGDDLYPAWRRMVSVEEPATLVADNSSHAKMTVLFAHATPTGSGRRGGRGHLFVGEFGAESRGAVQRDIRGHGHAHPQAAGRSGRAETHLSALAAAAAAARLRAFDRHSE